MPEDRPVWSPVPTREDEPGHRPVWEGSDRPPGDAATPPPWSPPPTGRDEPPPAWHPPDEPPRRRRPVGLGLVLIAVGVLWMLSLAGIDLRWEIVLPAALVVVGLLVVLSPTWGGGDGLIGLGIVLAILALVLAVPSPAAFSAGDRTIAVTDVADLEARYGLGAGTMTLDLRELELPTGTTEVRAGVNLGELVVLVPPDVTIAGEGRVAMGEVERFGRASGGIAPRAELASPGDDADRILELDLRVGLGQIEVRR
jgi:hypothetical protein